MLSIVFTELDEATWSEGPMTTNAVERRNRDCKCDNPSLKQAMLKVYRVDKVHCLRHITAEQGSSISYRSRSTEARAAEASKRQKRRYSTVPSDREAEFGPPDKVTNFNMKSSPTIDKTPQTTKKMAIEVNNTLMQYIPDSHPELMGTSVRMRFEIAESEKHESFEGIISAL